VTRRPQVLTILCSSITRPTLCMMTLATTRLQQRPSRVLRSRLARFADGEAVAVNDNTISSMPLSRRWRFMTICGEGPESATERCRGDAGSRRPACSSGIRRAGAATGTRRGRRPPGDVAANMWSTNSTPTPIAEESAAGAAHARRYPSEPINVIRPAARRIRPAASSAGSWRKCSSLGH
jgi:hypothetical protein